MEDLESQKDFLSRRAAEERDQAAESACMVRAVHEELAEAYSARLDAIPDDASDGGDEPAVGEEARRERVSALFGAMRPEGSR